MNRVTFFLGLISMLLVINPAAATIIHIPGDYPTIQQGINAATDGDTVLVAPDVYYESIIVQEKSLLLMSELGPHCTRIEGDGTSSVIRIIDCLDITVGGFTITGGNSSWGGGVYLQGRDEGICRIRHCVIRENSAGRGGAISGENLQGQHYGTAVVEYTIIRKNTSWNGGATDYPLSLVHHCVIDSNLATNHGGGLMLYGSVNHTDVHSNTFVANETYGDGGAICRVAGATPTIHNNVFLNNIAGGDGGALGRREDGLYFEYPYNCYHGNTPNDLGGGFGLGTGSFIDDPELFVSSDRLRYEPQHTSPLIDSGDPALPLDPDGSVPDIGARPYSHLGNVAWIELVQSGPPDWGYRLTCESGFVERVIFRDYCDGTSASLTGFASCTWNIAEIGNDSIVFLAEVGLTDHMAHADTFWLSHPTCSDYVTWQAGDSIGAIEGPLPVELTTFRAFAGDGQVILRWQTATEQDNDHFVLYKRRSGQEDFNMLAEIPGQGTTTEPHDYEYVDQWVQNGITYEYQISDVDIAGHETFYGEIVSATPRRDAVPLEYALHPNWPNPFNPTTTIRYDVKENGPVSLIIFDLLGREVATLADRDHTPNSYTITWDATGFPSGIYLCRMDAEGFEQVRKLLLVK